MAGTQNGGEGLAINGGQAWVEEAKITNNAGGGIVVDGGGTLVLDNSFVGGGNVANRAAIDIVDGTLQMNFTTVEMIVDRIGPRIQAAKFELVDDGEGTADQDGTCAWSDPEHPLCLAEPCVACTADDATARVGTTPICEVETSICVWCVLHAQCPDRACNPDGTYAWSNPEHQLCVAEVCVACTTDDATARVGTTQIHEVETSTCVVCDKHAQYPDRTLDSVECVSCEDTQTMTAHMQGPTQNIICSWARSAVDDTTACTGTTPICNVKTSICVWCANHEQHPDSACNLAAGLPSVPTRHPKLPS
jgi:hypothetical protein